MSYERAVQTSMDYGTYRFGRARQLYRGPKPDLTQPYLTCIGGTETFGKFVNRPYPQVLEERLNFTVANFGTPAGGPSFFFKDPVLLETLSNSRACIIQVMPAWANPNRLYSVRKRRNERLNGVSEMLAALYPDIDMTEYRYAQNLLNRLYSDDPKKFKLVELELRAAWIARMRELCDQIETRKILFWFSERRPEDDGGLNASPEKLVSPAFVDRKMIEAIRPMVDEVVEYVADPDAGAMLRLERQDGRGGLDVSKMLPSPDMHLHGARQLEPVIRSLTGIRD